MKYILILFSLLSSFSLFSQIKPIEFFEKKDKIALYPVEHATFVVKWQEKSIYIDPTGGPTAFNNIQSPDIILITDIHGDHLDLKTVEAISTLKTIIVAPKAVTEKLVFLKNKIIVLENFADTKIGEILIKAIPMYNLPETSDSRHPKGRGNGYILKLGKKNLYISGDTEDIAEMRSLKKIDLAFVCMNLPFTMDIHQAANAVLDFKPKIVIPYHYRGQGGFSDVDKFKEVVSSSSKKIRVDLLKWYPDK